MSTPSTDPESAAHESTAVATPDDAAVVYTWANLKNAKYRDLSASRRRYHAQPLSPPPTLLSPAPHCVAGPAAPHDPETDSGPGAGVHSSLPAPDGSAETPRRRREDASDHDSTPEALLRRRREDSVAFRPPSLATAQPGLDPTPPAPDPPQSFRPGPTHIPSSGPAWFSAAATIDPETTSTPLHAPASVADTLQHSRERVASRWFALKGVFEHPGTQSPEPAPPRQNETRPPVVAVFSLAGGVGKTSLVATLGRSLASLGEKVLLTDTTSHGLLPFYFGATELRQGAVRTFSPPSGSTDAPISLLSYDVDGCDDETQEALAEDVARNSRGTHRVLLDLNFNSVWVARSLARSNPTVLVPVAPDMNSVISLQTVERIFREVLDADGRPLKVFYLLNQFDSSLPLHLDVREVLRRQLCEQLLPFAIRRAHAVSEALAEGMTVVDYSPESPVTEDYAAVASWLRTVAAPATAGFRLARWSEW